MRKRYKLPKLRFISAFMVGTILLQYFITPAAIAVTVEQQIFSGEEKDPFQKTSNPSAVRSTAPDTNALEGKSATIAGMQQVPYKDPRLACLLSLMLPGSGEIYLRKDLKGITFCLATTTTYLLSFYYLYLGFLGPAADQRKNLIIGSVGFIAGVIIHIVSMVESYNDAVLINEARYFFSE